MNKAIKLLNIPNHREKSDPEEMRAPGYEIPPSPRKRCEVVKDIDVDEIGE